MIWGRRVESLVLMACGILLGFVSYDFAHKASYDTTPMPQSGLFSGLGFLSSAILLCTGAVLDYLHQRGRPL